MGRSRVAGEGPASVGDEGHVGEHAVDLFDEEGVLVFGEAAAESGLPGCEGDVLP